MANPTPETKLPVRLHVPWAEEPSGFVWWRELVVL